MTLFQASVIISLHFVDVEMVVFTWRTSFLNFDRLTPNLFICTSIFFCFKYTLLASISSLLSPPHFISLNTSFLCTIITSTCTSPFFPLIVWIFLLWMLSEYKITHFRCFFTCSPIHLKRKKKLMEYKINCLHLIYSLSLREASVWWRAQSFKILALLKWHLLFCSLEFYIPFCVTINLIIHRALE